MDDSDDTRSEKTGDDASETGRSETGGLVSFDRPRRRLATVYDAVSGRVWGDQLRQDRPGDKARSPSEPPPPPQKSTTRHVNRDAPHAPEDVLFRRKDAPTRYAEHDIYHAHERDLPANGSGALLPGSDLVKAVHTYAARFYGAMGRDHQRRRQKGLGGRSVDERSMDETALLAFGILLEEAGREVLGRRGDLVFTEAASPPPGAAGEEGGEEEEEAAPERGQGQRQSQARAGGGRSRKSSSDRSAKRRKVSNSELSSLAT